MPAGKRAFGPDNIRTKAEDYHGSARTRIKRTDKAIHLNMSFEEALKFSVAVQECVQALNRKNRSTAQGRQMGLCMSIKSDVVSIIEAPVKSPPLPEE